MPKEEIFGQKPNAFRVSFGCCTHTHTAQHRTDADCLQKENGTESIQSCPPSWLSPLSVLCVRACVRTRFVSRRSAPTSVCSTYLHGINLAAAGLRSSLFSIRASSGRRARLNQYSKIHNYIY